MLRLNTKLICSTKTTKKTSEKKYDPKTPEIVFFGLIELNFFPLNILPKTNFYPLYFFFIILAI